MFYSLHHMVRTCTSHTVIWKSSQMSRIVCVELLFAERETRILHVELNSERKSRQRDMLCVSQHKVETQSPVVTSKTNTLPQLYCDWRDTIKRYRCRVRYLLCHPLEINDPIKHLAYGVSPSQWTMQLTLLFSIAQPLQRLLFCCLGPSWSALLAWS